MRGTTSNTSRAIRSHLFACALVAIAFALCSAPRASAQEYLDTAGRWKSLSLPSDQLEVPRAMVAHRGHVIIGRENRSVLVSRDSGETWTKTGSALPAGVVTVWALAHPDTLATPNRVVGVATTATPARTRVIESTDGGFTWRDVQMLPELDILFTAPLDTMRLYGPPAILFVRNSAGGAPTGFIYSAAGLMASSDGGLTWSRRADSLAIRAMAMADERNGIAALGKFQPNTKFSSQSGGISWTSDGGATWTETYSFTDGGFFQYLTLRAFSTTDVRAFVPERFQNYMDWRMLRSVNGGRSWNDYRGRQAKRPLYGLAVWRDTSDLHVISDGAILQHASDGGELFHLLRDTTSGWFQTPLDEIAGYVTKAPIAATDGRYLYFTVRPNNYTARWRMASIEPFSAVNDESVVHYERALQVSPNPIRRGSPARLFLGSALKDVSAITIVDALGRTRAIVDVAPRAVSVAIAATLSTGRYLAVAQCGRTVYRVSFVILGE